VHPVARGDAEEVHAAHVPVHDYRVIENPYFWWGVLALIAAIIVAVVGRKIGTAAGRGKTPAPAGTPGAAWDKFPFPVPPLQDLIGSAKKVESAALRTWPLFKDLGGRDPASDTVVGWKIGTAIGRGKIQAPQGTAGAARADFLFPIPPLEDLILSAKEVEPTALRTRRLLEELARRDPALEPSSLDAFIRATFLKVQRCWEKRDYRPVRDLLVPSLLAEHEEKLQAMRRDGLINRLESLSVRRLEFVHVFCPKATDTQQVTALITFDARAYFVHEKTAKYVHGALRVLPYQEYWVFCRRGDTWRLRTIDRDQVDHRGLRSGAVG
jgi:hypothetical protein